jgi:23S rRNA pseudouridine1911/1915/1917 synthase
MQKEYENKKIDFTTRIIYEDNYLFVVDKPYGISTLGGKNSYDLIYQAKEYIKTIKGKKGNVYLGLVHRLDKETSGVLMFAKNSKSASRVSELIKEKMFFKLYLAILDKEARDYERMEDLLWKNPEENKCYVLAFEDRDKVKLAITDYYKIFDCLYLVLPFTGRYHQIRCQLAYRGYPIKGDMKYGSSFLPPMRLHSFMIATIHPRDKDMIFFFSLPEKDFVNEIGISTLKLAKKLSNRLEFISLRYNVYFPKELISQIFKYIISGKRLFFFR